MATYIDTSALVKLVVAEPDSDALRAWLEREEPELVACDLVRTELIRATRRTVPDRMLLARDLLDALTLIRVSTSVFDAAGRLDPVGMRSLDSIHLAAALDLGDDLDSLVTYEERLADAATANGVPVVAPRS